MFLEEDYLDLKNMLEDFSKEFLEDNTELLKLLDKLKKKAPSKIVNAKNLELLAAALCFIYAKKSGLNKKQGLTAKKIGEFFNLKASSISAKASDIGYDIGEKKLPSSLNEPYEFIDEDRYEIKMEYYDFLESEDTKDINKAIKKLKGFIKKDPYFFDPYISLAEYYLYKKDLKSHIDILQKGYEKAMKLLTKDGVFPDILEWGFLENRHIIRMIYNYALLMWSVGEKKRAVNILKRLLKTNINDNIGARYAIVAILEGYENIYEFEEQFEAGIGLDAFKLEEWFEKAAKKHKDVIGWWFKAVGEEI